MFFRRVIDDEIHDELHATFLDLFDEIVNIFQRSIAWVDILVVGNVIAHVSLRALVDWRHPYHINTQVFQIVKLLCDARNIAPAVVVGVFERGGVHLSLSTIGRCRSSINTPGIRPPLSTMRACRCRRRDPFWCSPCLQSGFCSPIETLRGRTVK
jgi:hypothetical protein